MQRVAVYATGLQRERAQAQCEATTHALGWVRQRIHGACVGQRFATTRGGHVDDERAARGAGAGHAGSQVGGLVLPAKPWIVAALPQALVPGQPGQVTLEARQCMAYLAGMHRDADKVFVQRLVELAITGVRVERVARWHADPLDLVLRSQTGVMVVCQHQRQPGDMHDIRIAEPITFASRALQLLEA